MEPLFLCEWCDKSFVRKYNLEKHINISKKCIELRESCAVECDYCGIEYNNTKVDDHLQNCTAYYRFHYNATIIKLTKAQKKVKIMEPKVKKLELAKKKIRELELELAENKGKLSQHTTQSININGNIDNKTINYITKIKQLPVKGISPLNDEFIDSFIEEKYTFEVFYGRYPAILNWFKQLTTLEFEGIIEQNYACGDITRNNFWRLEDKTSNAKWKKDPNALWISKVLDKMIGKTLDYNAKFNLLLVKESDDRDLYRAIMKDINKVCAGITVDTARSAFVTKLIRDAKSHWSVT
jgi:hypothetical protein